MSEESPSDSQGKIIVFGAKQIRRAWVDDQWYFSVIDIISVLTDSPNPRDYWYRVKRRERESSGPELSTKCRQLRLASAAGKYYQTEVVNTESAFRVIQSIPGPKAEPFKRWLARVGRERIEEIANPEVAQKRIRKLFRQKGYPDDWIEKRIRGKEENYIPRFMACADDGHRPDALLNLIVEVTGEKKKDKAARDAIHTIQQVVRPNGKTGSEAK